MKKSIRIVKDLLIGIALAPVLLLYDQNATAIEQRYLTPYLRIEGQAKHLNWGAGFGKNIFKRNLREGNIFGSVKFSHAHSFNGSFNILTTESRFHNRRTIAPLGAGVQYMPWDCVGLRATLGWENTRRFNNLAPKNVVSSPLLIKMKNLLKPGLGAFVTF